MKLTNLEKETIILFNEHEKQAEIYTFSKKLIRKIRNANEKYPEIFKIKKEDKNGAVTLELPKDRLGIRLLLPQSEERSQKQAERMIELRKTGAIKPTYNGKLEVENIS